MIILGLNCAMYGLIIQWNIVSLMDTFHFNVIIWGTYIMELLRYIFELCALAVSVNSRPIMAKSWKYCRKRLTFLIRDFGSSERYNFYNPMNEEFNNHHHLHQVTWRAWWFWFNTIPIFSYMIESKEKTTILPIMNS